MREAHKTERAVGMRWYASDHEGTGGRLRADPTHFRVRELEGVSPEPVDASPEAYPHLVIRAELSGWETHAFATALSNALGISRERIRWAGTKDARAVTTQLVSVDGIEPGALPDLERADLAAVGRLGRPLGFGDLAGNAFAVVVDGPERPAAVEAITGELEALAGTEDGLIGVPNYFGQQRFGSHRPITHAVGRAILRGDWEEAVTTYVAESFPAEPAETRRARSFLAETRDWTAGLERFPGHLRYERSMLHVLASTDGEPDAAAFRTAIDALPRTLQRLFVHAAQSEAFNRIVSERLARGLPLARPVEGDVVCVRDGGAPGDLVVPDPERTQRVTRGRVETATRHCRRERAFVTAPLVGTETTLAEGEPGDVERSVLDELELARDDFALEEPFHSSGTRRAVLVRTDLEWDRDPPTARFALPRGAYATVVLREYMKVDPTRLS